VALKKQLRAVMLSACHNPDKEQERTQRANYQVDLIEQYMPPGRVYDVGAAAGFFMRVARDHGWEVQGNETSETAIAWAKAHYQLAIDYGFLEDLDPPTGYFDAVVLWNTLEHVVDPRCTVELCVAMLRTGGVLLIEVPDKDKKALIKHPEDQHMTEFNHDNLPRFLEHYGLQRRMLERRSKKGYTYMELLYQKG
jgi:2-polyprenyl-3-methyl-5-hydroxy-6-metoxy-1,4-benzoquinol methylase